MKRTLLPSAITVLGVAAVVVAAISAGAYLSHRKSGETVATAYTPPADNPVSAPKNLLSNGTASGYQVNENTGVGTDLSTANTGPVRMARVSNLNGDVAWRPNTSTPWSSVAMNTPIRQGGQVWVKKKSRAELQFDDGSYLRLGGGAVASMNTMYSDKRGEYTDVALDSGIATLRTRNALSKYRIDTPYTTVEENAPGEVRVGVGDRVEVVAQEGDAYLVGDQGTSVLQPQQYVDVASADAPYVVEDAPVQHDSWDQYCNQRDTVVDNVDPNLPSDIGLVAGDMQDYGTWQSDPQYGRVWTPDVSSDWRPYSDGRWVYENPVGWTWCDNQPWGYAPSHYGTWTQRNSRWEWCPGPAQQYWSPANVNFCDNGNDVAWAPLAPEDVHYPAALSIGFQSGDWSLNFSIGQVASYFPVGNYCEARPWDNRYINNSGDYYDPQAINAVYNTTNVYNNNTYMTNNNFVPHNAYDPNSVNYANRDQFINGNRFNAATDPNPAQFFAHGRRFGQNAPLPISGPVSVRPTLAAFTPARTWWQSHPEATVLNRPVHRAPEPVAIAQSGPRGFGTRNYGAPNRSLAANRPSATQAAPNAGFGQRNQRFGMRATSTPNSPTTVAPRTFGRSAMSQPATQPRPYASRPALGTPRAFVQPRTTQTAPRTFARTQTVTAPRAQRTFARPAPRAFTRPQSTYTRPAPQRTFARPAPRAFTRPQSTYSRPAPQRTFARPAPRAFTRPQSTYTRPAPQRTFARPAPRAFTRPQSTYTRPAPQRTFARPAPRAFTRPQSTYTRPAPQRSYNNYSRPAPQSYSRPAPQRSYNNYSRPVPQSYSRPAPQRSYNNYSRPVPQSYSRPAPQRSYNNYSRPVPQSYSRPAPQPSYSRPAPRAFARPAPQPSYSRPAPQSYSRPAPQPTYRSAPQRQASPRTDPGKSNDPNKDKNGGHR